MNKVVQFFEKLETHPKLSDELSDELDEARQQLKKLVDDNQRHSDALLVDTIDSEEFASVDLPDSRIVREAGDLGQVDLSEASEVTVEEGLPIPLDERYEDLGQVTRGGMGEIRRVRDRDLNRVAIMKIIRTDRLETRIALLRFIEEAQITAQLAHPGIPAVHELGRLSDGRVYFTMRQVDGRTLDTVIDRVHEHFGGDLLAEDDYGWSLRELIEALEDLCATLGFAHSRGVVHRDLKPQNIMVGAFDVVQVLDWGIAKVAGRSDTHSSGDEDPLALIETDLERNETRDGVVMGTAAYMAPEQVRGQIERIQPATDVFALGVLMYEMLVGRPPFEGEATLEILLQILEGPVTPIEAYDHVPEALARICTRALSAAPKDRFSSASKMGEAIEDWLEGTARRERARRMLEDATDLHDEIESVRSEAGWLERRSRDRLKDVAPNAPFNAKQEAWKQEERARGLRRKVARLEVKYVEHLREALNHAPNLDSARRRLADYFRAEHERAEHAGDEEHAEETLAYLESYDDGRYADYLSGHGRLSLACDHSGARASLFRFVKRNRRLVTEFVCELGDLPLEEVELAHGSYLVRITSADTIEVDYPVQIERAERWCATPEDEDRPRPVHLPKRGTVGPNEVYILAGWFPCGGDRRAPQALNHERIWVEDFIIQRYPVTHRDYLVFLNALVTGGRTDEALDYAPSRAGGVGDRSDECAYERTANGMFVPPVDDEAFGADHPVSLIDWYAARAYAQWLREETEKPWRLPSEFEWEKAARGVDARAFPWGDFLDPTWCCMLDSQGVLRSPVSVEAFPVDESPYGVRGLGGNVRTWCREHFRAAEGTPSVPSTLQLDASLCLPDDAASDARVYRGGAWYLNRDQCRSAARDGNHPTARFHTVGVRLVRPVTRG